VEAFKAMDIANTNIHDPSTKLFDLDFLSTPRLSTIANAYLINRLVKAMPADQCYLNIGVWCGFSLFAGTIDNPGKSCIGVDNFSDPRGTKSVFEHQFAHFKNPSLEFFEMDYLDYFKNIHKKPIGVYFYDGDHAYEHQFLGLEKAHPYLTVGSYIIVDDTDVLTEGEYAATMDFVRKNPTQYKVVLDVETANNGHPTFWAGLLVIKKIS
jgi:hypothetical protein